MAEAIGTALLMIATTIYLRGKYAPLLAARKAALLGHKRDVARTSARARRKQADSNGAGK